MDIVLIVVLIIAVVVGGYVWLSGSKSSKVGKRKHNERVPQPSEWNEFLNQTVRRDFKTRQEFENYIENNKDKINYYLKSDNFKTAWNGVKNNIERKF